MPSSCIGRHPADYASCRSNAETEAGADLYPKERSFPIVSWSPRFRLRKCPAKQSVGGAERHDFNGFSPSTAVAVVVTQTRRTQVVGGFPHVEYLEEIGAEGSRQKALKSWREPDGCLCGNVTVCGAMFGPRMGIQ